MTKEIEVKSKVKNHDAVIQKLTALGVKLGVLEAERVTLGYGHDSLYK